MKLDISGGPHRYELIDSRGQRRGVYSDPIEALSAKLDLWADLGVMVAIILVVAGAVEVFA